MQVSQNVMDLMSGAAAACGALARRASRTQGPDTAKPGAAAASPALRAGIAVPVLRACGVAGRPPAGKAQRLARQIVERRGERGEAQRKTRGVDRIVRRRRAPDRNGERLGVAGNRDARDANGHRPCADIPARQRIEKLEGRMTGAPTPTPYPSPQGGGGFGGVCV